MENNREAMISALKEQIESSSDKVLVEYLEKIDISDRYVIIRDYISAKRMSRFRNDEDSKELYRKFQLMKEEAKKQWDHDHTAACMIDIDKALTRLYDQTLKYMNAMSIDIEWKFNRVFDAINKIEERLGIDKTSWVDSDMGDINSHTMSSGAPKPPWFYMNKQIRDYGRRIEPITAEDVENESVNVQGEQEDN